MKTLYLPIFCIVFLLPLGGCSTSTQKYELVPDAENQPIISLAKMTCKKPIHLTQDCSGLIGPKKKITIDGITMRIGGTADNKTVVMFSLMTKKNENLAYDSMKRILLEKGIKIVKVSPIASIGVMGGYAIETDKPNYRIWDAYADKE